MNSRRIVSLPFAAWLLGVRTRKTRFRGHCFPYRLISRSLRLSAFKTCETMAVSEEQRLQACLIAFNAGDAESKDELISHACHQMQQMAHRMLVRFPNVGRHGRRCSEFCYAAGLVNPRKEDLELRKNWWVNLEFEHKYQQTIFMHSKW